MGGASGAAADAVHVLVALGRVLGEVDAGAEHAADVGVALVKALVDDGVDEGRAWWDGWRVEGGRVGQRRGGVGGKEAKKGAEREKGGGVMERRRRRGERDEGRDSRKME